MIGKLLWVAAFVTGTSVAASISLPGGSLTVPGTGAGSVSFTYSGTLTQDDTLAFTQTGNPCLQPNGSYCANGAGVLTVAGSLGAVPPPVGSSLPFSGPVGIIPAGTWTYGSLLLTISGVGTVQLFAPNAGNGLGSARPPAGLNLPATALSALGFGSFSQTDPTLTFIVADIYFGDNSGQFVLSQAATTDLTDIWWNPAESGWGMQLNSSGAFVFATVFVYGTDGKPTWMIGELNRTGSAPATAAGPLYVTTGPYYGGAWDPNAFAYKESGTMTFVPTSVSTGLVTYSVDGVVVNKSVRRETLRQDDYSGTYTATDTRTGSGCLDAANNGTRTTAATIQFAPNGSSMSAVWTLPNSNVCTHTGTYSQLGRMGTLVADYSCTSGETGTATYSEMTVSLGIFKARLDTHSATLGCTTTGRVAGVIPN